jgi:uncharacterized membrane protein YhiD involved in acid resistance
MTSLRTLIVTAALLGSAVLQAQPPTEPPDTTAAVFPGADPTDTPDSWQQLTQLYHAATRLPLAAALACVLAVRPRRRGTPPRKASVIETQIILAVVGAVVMLVVGQSLARAFGIVGAAGLVRYRAKIEDPKDAAVMLSTLAIGLACGVGLWMVAAFGTVFVMALLWIIESFEKARHAFLLTVKAKDASAMRPKVEELLARQRVEFELRTAAESEICYEVNLPLEKKTDRLSNAILRLGQDGAVGVEFEEKKEKK